MFLRIQEFFVRVYDREEAMEDARWLLLALGALLLEIGLIKALISLNSGLPYLTGSALLILFGVLPFFWFRVAALFFLIAGLSADLVIRRNPFCVFFVWIALFHAFHLFRSQKEIAQVPEEGSNNES
jgi:hypothetical protein